MKITETTFEQFRDACINAGFASNENYRNNVKLPSPINGDVSHVVTLTESWGPSCFDSWKEDFISYWEDGEFEFSRNEYGRFVVTIKNKAFNEWRIKNIFGKSEMLKDMGTTK